MMIASDAADRIAEVLEALQRIGVSPASVSFEGGMIVFIVPADGLLETVDRFHLGEIDTSCRIMADLGPGRGWAVCEIAGFCFVERFLTRACAIEWFSGDFDDAERLHERDVSVAKGASA